MNPKIKNYETCTAENCFIKKGCSGKWIAKLEENKTAVFYKKGQQVIFEGNPVLGMYFISSGKVSVFATGYNGRRQIVRLANSGEILGHRGYGGEKYPIGAIALEDSIICFLENDILMDAFEANPKFTFLLMMYYSQELRKTEMRMKCLAQMTVREKVADALLFLNDAFGVTLDQGNSEKSSDNFSDQKLLDVEVSRKDLADIAGISSQQASRVISTFKEDRLIKSKDRKIILLQYNKLFAMVKAYYTYKPV